jgi:hypothetical protein
MIKHLYNSKLTKFRWFASRFGVSEMLFKPLRTAFAPIIIPNLQAKRFPFKGVELDYLYHRYNMTWASERCVEVPIGRYYANQAPSSRVLEVGNVLSHYGPVEHTIIDKYEAAPGVMNVDIANFTRSEPFSTIFSISTFEHIGFDDEPGSGSTAKIKNAVASCRKLLAIDGTFVITVPIGYNPELDAMIASGELAPKTEFYMRRVKRLTWAPVTKENALGCKYRKPFPYANAIMIAEWTGRN